MAGEYLRAAKDQQLTYRQLKTLARNSLAYSFMAGAALSSSPACAASDAMALGDPPSTECGAFLDANERAKMQWELERRFLAFESSL